MINNIIRLSLLSLIILCLSCKSKPTNTMASFYTGQTVECVSADREGNEIVKVFATGVNQEAAIAEAKEVALHTVVFKGIITDKKECSVKPILKEVNAAEKYKKYFDSLFKEEEGKKKYAIVTRAAFQSNVMKSGIRYESYSVEVIVSRREIQERIEQDKIVK